MLACVIYEGKMAIKCKSSNGKDVGEDAYIYVDISSCRIKPSRLLFDFYSIDMENGPYEVKNLKKNSNIKRRQRRISHFMGSPL